MAAPVSHQSAQSLTEILTRSIGGSETAQRPGSDDHGAGAGTGTPEHLLSEVSSAGHVTEVQPALLLAFVYRDWIWCQWRGDS